MRSLVLTDIPSSLTQRRVTCFISRCNWTSPWLSWLWCICGPQNSRFPMGHSRDLTQELAPIAACENRRVYGYRAQT